METKDQVRMTPAELAKARRPSLLFPRRCHTLWAIAPRR